MFSPEESRCTKSHDVADGALIGPGSSNIASVLNIKEEMRDSNHEGELCQWHALVKVAEHSDKLEEGQPNGLMVQYYAAARRLRKLAAFCGGQKMCRAIAKHSNQQWARQMCHR